MTHEQIAIAIGWLALAAVVWIVLAIVGALIDNWARRKVAAIEAEADGPDAASCEALPFFVAGELMEGAAEEYRKHLGDCAKCQREFTLEVTLRALEVKHLNGSRTDAN